MSDKRSVHTDALETLGSIIDENAGRDAIHIAVEPAVAAEKLIPGQDVGRVDGGFGGSDVPVGIVDPFLKHSVLPGERFWLLIYPRQITSLRHVWAHPAFDGETPNPATYNKAASEAWLRNFCANADCPRYETVMDKVSEDKGSWIGEYLHFYGMDAHGEIPAEFWVHAEIVLGKILEHKPARFSCGC